MVPIGGTCYVCALAIAPFTNEMTIAIEPLSTKSHGGIGSILLSRLVGNDLDFLQYSSRHV